MTQDLVQALEGARRLAARVARSAASLAPVRPFDAARVEALDDAGAERTDAFLKRFENLVVHLQDRLWRQVLVAEGHIPSQMSRRDVIEEMDRLGLVASADEVRKGLAIRIRLAHAYPMHPGLSGSRLEDALNAVPALLDCVARAEGYVARQ